MSDETFSVVAMLSILASLVGLWSSIRRRQIMRRLLRSLDEKQLAELVRQISQDKDADSPTGK